MAKLLASIADSEDMNPLELLTDHQVTDILINSTNEILVERDGQLNSTGHKFATELEVQKFAKDLIQQANSRVDLAKPFGEGKIDSSFGSLRVHCLLGGECSNGTLLSIRRHKLVQLTLNDLLSSNSLSDNQLIEVKEIVASKKNFVIVGPAGSGKTTLLRAMLNEAQNERVITIEDNPELNLMNQISLFSRKANSEGVGEITLEQLIREALRMRPDRIAIGEARGGEIHQLLQAMNTGHSGVGFTLHANGSNEVIPRILGMLSLSSVPPALGRMMIASSIDYVIEVTRNPIRRILSIERLVV